MRLIRRLADWPADARNGTVATIGNFDGAHLGHRAMLRAVHERAAALDVGTTVVSFEPLPHEFFAPERAPGRLQGLRERVASLDALDVDRLLLLTFDAERAAQDADAFVREVLVGTLAVRHVVIGDDFRFGRDRWGNLASLEAAGREHGFSVAACETVELDGARISSSRIRAHLAAGELDAAARLLGRPYRVSGRVVHGEKVGRTLGFPTANVALGDHRPPPRGVFAVHATDIADGRRWPAVANLGERPTVGGRKLLLEVHVLDASPGALRTPPRRRLREPHPPRAALRLARRAQGADRPRRGRRALGAGGRRVKGPHPIVAIAMSFALLASASHGAVPMRNATLDAPDTAARAGAPIDRGHPTATRFATGTFDKVHEPSGVTRLGDGTLIVVEDEPRRPMRRVTIAVDADALDGRDPTAGDAIRVVDEKRLKIAKGEREDVGELDDLEGVARDAADRVFVVGSHDDAGERAASDRQKLVRYALEDGRARDVVVSRRLRQDLLDAHPGIAGEIADGGRTDGALNIEALAVDRRRGHLLIGLRTPRLDKDAVIVRLSNPDAYVEGEAPAAFDAAPWTLDLDKGGLRALAYDDGTDQLLIVSRRESGKGGAFKLWRVAADGAAPPVRIRLPDEKDPFDDVEGLVPLGDGAGVLFVRDDGRRDGREGGGWFAVSRERLGLE